MASIRKEIQVAVAADRAWDALRDVGRIHERLVKGFVTDCRLDGDATDARVDDRDPGRVRRNGHRDRGAPRNRPRT